MDHKTIIDQLSKDAKIELIVLAQNTDEIIKPILDEWMEDPQLELDVLYELGFLDLDSDEEDEENARAEFSSDVEQFLIEEIGNQREHDLILGVFSRCELIQELKDEKPSIAEELEAIGLLLIADIPDIPDKTPSP